MHQKEDDVRSDAHAGYLGAIIAVLVGTAVRQALQPLLEGRTPWVFYFPLLAIVAWNWGIRPAILALLLSAIVGTYLFIPPVMSLALRETPDLVTLLAYLVSGAVITLFGGASHRNQARLREEARQREAAQRELKENLESFQAIFDNARGDGIILMDPQRRVRAWNIGAERIFGWTADEMVGNTGDRIFTERDQRDGAPQGEADSAARDGSSVDERWHVKADNTLFWGSGMMTALHHPDGSLRGFLKVLRDATERKRLADLLQSQNEELERRVEERTADLLSANAELEGFTYSVSHDMRAPLRSIVGKSAMLVEDYANQLPRDAQDQLERLSKSALKMNALVEDLLRFARLNKQAPVRTTCELAAMFRDVAADEARMVLENLVANAVKYRRRDIPLRLEFGQAERNGSPAFFVRDNGIGFDMQFREKLFRPFERLHRDADYPGTGIGLANVKRIIERHGGQVDAEGRPGEGATFWFTLP
jgi:PAS domain S-box-containing protein